MPLPEPLAPDVTVIHDALLTALQEQLLEAVTSTVPVLPTSPKAVWFGEAFLRERVGKMV